MKQLLILIGFLPFALTAQISTGNVPPSVELSGANGGRLNGQSWSSAELTGKVYTVMYVDPDEKEVNEHVEKALKSENFDRDKYGSVAIVNMAATWKPNVVIKMILDGKQKDYPNTIYVMDKNKVLVKQWGLADDNYHVLTFDKTGKLIFEKAGKMTDGDVQRLIGLIRGSL
jgi:hypothetical protein